MKKSTKSLWIYAAVLFLVAIGLIFITTLTQARLVSHEGSFEVLGTFNKNAQQSIAILTDENVKLSNELNEANVKIEKYQQDNAALQAAADTSAQMQKKVADLYRAYNAEDYETLSALLGEFTKESLDTYLPGFYDVAQEAVSNYME